MIRAAALLVLLASSAHAFPDDIWKHINTACTAGQSVVKNSGSSWSCGNAQDETSWTHSDIYATTSSVHTTSAGDFVGVGTSSPLWPLDVRGTIHSTSSATANAFFGDGSHLANISVNLSTVTTALATKLSNTAAIPTYLIDSSTITTALAAKHGLTIAISEIDLSTVTTALATKASSGTDNSMTRANALATLGAAVVAVTTVTASGQINMGYERVVNACGAGVTTCTATCSAGKVAFGGGCDGGGVALTGDTGSSAAWTCTSIALTTVTATVYCGRMGP